MDTAIISSGELGTIGPETSEEAPRAAIPKVWVALGGRKLGWSEKQTSPREDRATDLILESRFNQSSPQNPPTETDKLPMLRGPPNHPSVYVSVEIWGFCCFLLFSFLPHSCWCRFSLSDRPPARRWRDKGLFA